MAVDAIGSSSTADRCPPFAVGAVAAVAAGAGVVLALAATRYGYFYDELYFIAAGKRLSVSYADQGPVLPLLARTMDWLFPGSFAALRIPSIVLTVVGLVASAAIARELGGGRSAQVLTAAGYATSMFLMAAAPLSTNSIDAALWVVISWLVVRWVRTRRDVLLLAAGVVTAVDMQVKWLVPVLWVAIVVGASWLGPRELLRRPALWAGAGIVVLATTPALLWQARHGWPQLGMTAEVRRQTATLVGSLAYLPLAVVLNGVLGALLLSFGVWRLCRSPRLRPYRFLGVAVLIVLAAFAIGGGRIYYAAGAYPMVMAAGAVELTALRTRWVTIGVVPVAVVSAVVLVLTATPWKPVSQLQPARDKTEALSSMIFGEFGWSELAGATAGAYHALAPSMRNDVVIVTQTYAQAGALDRERARVGLPSVFSPHRGFGYFGAPPDTAETVLWVGGSEAELRGWFSSVVPVAKSDVPLGIPGITREVTIWECGSPRQPWSALWPRVRRL